MKILVTGGAGFMGSHFIRHILKNNPGAEVLNYDKLTYAGNQENVRDIAENPRYRFVHGDIADQKLVGEVLASYRPDYLINFAAETHVDRSINLATDEFLNSFIHSNIIGVHNLLDTVKRYKNLKKFVQISTDEVYGSLKLDSADRFSEITSIKPNNLYAVTKAAGDLMCGSYHNHLGLPIVIARSSNYFGSHQYPEKLIPYSVSRLLQGQKILIHGDGKHVRDWIHVDDSATAFELCLFKGKNGEVYNIGAHNEYNNLEIARLILQYFNLDESFMEFVPDRPGNDRRYAIESAKIQKELGWKPLSDFKEKFFETLAWYKKNKQWMDNVFQKNKTPGYYNFHG